MDCRSSSRMQVVGAMGTMADFGWIDANDVLIGWMDCDDVLLHQHPTNGDVFVMSGGGTRYSDGTRVSRPGRTLFEVCESYRVLRRFPAVFTGDSVVPPALRRVPNEPLESSGLWPE